jgi:protein-tyrosine phosphatase
MFSSILTVCTSNMCRGPLAEYRLKQLLEGLRVHIESAGIHALASQPADASVQRVAKENGIDLTSHKARAVTRSMVQKYEMILVMETHDRRVLCEQFSMSKGKIFLLGQ